MSANGGKRNTNSTPRDTWGKSSQAPLLTTDAYLGAIFEDTNQYREDPTGRDDQREPIVEDRVDRVAVGDPDCHAPAVAENGVAPQQTPFRDPHATAL